jgi:hypothetical protein
MDIQDSIVNVATTYIMTTTASSTDIKIGYVWLPAHPSNNKYIVETLCKYLNIPCYDM